MNSSDYNLDIVDEMPSEKIGIPYVLSVDYTALDQMRMNIGEAPNSGGIVDTLQKMFEGFVDEVNNKSAPMDAALDDAQSQSALAARE